MKQYAGALLLTPDSKVILQQRDNKPGIENPGLVTFFGGAVEDGDTPDKALLRELEEELGLTSIHPKKYKVLYKTLARHGEDRVMHIFIINNISPESLQTMKARVMC